MILFHVQDSQTVTDGSVALGMPEAPGNMFSPVPARTNTSRSE